MLLAMRRALGWVTEIPRHGPDTREKMDKLKDAPEDEKVSVGKPVKTGNDKDIDFDYD